MRIALGSTSPSKVRAARAVFSQAFPGAEVVPVAVASGVAAQPTSDDEAIRGALHRAREARALTGADMGVGIEGGVHRAAGGVWVSAWVAVVDASGREGLGSGLRVRLPDWMAERAARGEELGVIVDSFARAADTHETWGAIGLLTAGLVDRQSALQQAIAAALPPFLRSPLYARSPDEAQPGQEPPVAASAPPTERLYRADSYLTAFDAEVVAQQPLDAGIAVELSHTAFYPTSGGQPHDTGTLDGVRVIDVRENGGRVLHVVSAAVDGRVHGVVDWARRFDHMQQHTGQHILSQAALRALGAQTRSVHFGAEAATLDLDRQAVTHEDVAATEDLANRVVLENRLVHVREVDESELPALGLRRPAKQTGRIRVVDIEGFDRSACGGTHVRRTGEVGCIKVRRWERHRGGIRLEFVCGWRAVRDYQRKHALVADLAASFSAGETDVPQAVARLAGQVREHERTIEELRDTLLAREAAGLLAAAEGMPKVVAAVVSFPPADAALLAGKLTASASCAAVIGSTGVAEGRLVIARSADVALDAGAALRQVLERFGGRGGGRPEFAQGAVPAGQVAAAVEAARSLVRRQLDGPGG